MPDRKSAPPFTSLTNFQLPTPEVAALSNGCNLVSLDIVRQDVIKIELLFKSGKWFETLPGTAHFTAQLLDKGTPDKTAYQIATWFDLHGASVEINAGLDFTSVSLYSLASNVQLSLPLFFQLITVSTFPDDELLKAKDIFIQNLRLNFEKNSFVASRIIRRNIFGELHPYGATLEEQHLNQLHSDALAEYFKTRFTPLEVYVTGTLNTVAKNMLVELLQRLKFNSASDPKDFLVSKSGNVQHLEKPESIQTSLRLGKRSISRAHPDYPSVILLNHILGGYFGSRLMKNLREEKGLTYGIHSSVSGFAHDAVFMIGTDVNKQDRELAINEIKREISRLGTDLVPNEELMLARNHLLGGLQLDAANPFAIMDKIKLLRTYNLTPDYYNSLFSGIMMTSPHDLKNLAAEHLYPESMSIVSVG
ncbi:MAG: insulinase family protein [Cyclobacteriaceae bacterium]|nr:insulinase family protein [Cyclobacteriaceae bacterium]